MDSRLRLKESDLQMKDLDAVTEPRQPVGSADRVGKDFEFRLA